MELPTFKAPQKKLRTSWVEMAFSKPQKGALIVRKSLSSRPQAIVTYLGVIKHAATIDTY